MTTKKFKGMASGPVNIGGNSGLEQIQSTPGKTGLFVIEMTETVPHEATKEIQNFCDGNMVDLSGIAGPYSKFVNMVIDALKDHRIENMEAFNLAMEVGHLSGVDQKLTGMITNVISRIVPGKKK